MESPTGDRLECLGWYFAKLSPSSSFSSAELALISRFAPPAYQLQNERLPYFTGKIRRPQYLGKWKMTSISR